HRRIAPQNRGVECGVPGTVCVWVGAGLEKERRELSVTAMARNQQDAATIGRGGVDVRTRTEEEPGAFDVPLLGSEQERREGTLLDLHHLRIAGWSRRPRFSVPHPLPSRAPASPKVGPLLQQASPN